MPDSLSRSRCRRVEPTPSAVRRLDFAADDTSSLRAATFGLWPRDVDRRVVPISTRERFCGRLLGSMSMIALHRQDAAAYARLCPGTCVSGRESDEADVRDLGDYSADSPAAGCCDGPPRSKAGLFRTKRIELLPPLLPCVLSARELSNTDVYCLRVVAFAADELL